MEFEKFSLKRKPAKTMSNLTADEAANTQDHSGRNHERISVHLELRVHHANASDMDRPALNGITNDVSSTGCYGVFNRPLLVGNIYRVEFITTGMNLPETLARCVRCRFIHDSAYEAALSFFTPVEGLVAASEPKA